MEYRRLGKSGLKVSELCLGTMMFGDRTDEPTAQRIADSAADAGVNFIDTADSYAKSVSEQITGKVIGAKRDRWILATKVYNRMGSEPNDSGLGRRWLMKEIDASLKRLNTSYLDIWYFHADDLKTPIEESVAAVGDIIRAGKVRYFGLSNYQSWRVGLVVHACEKLGVPQPIVCQPYYNAMNRQPETELLPACAHYGLGVVPYSPLARGVLTGKYLPGQTPPQESRAGRKDRRIMETEFREESLVMAQQIKAHAEKRGMTAAQFALNWVRNNALVTSVLAGPRTEEQWQEYLGALAFKLTDEDEALIDGLVKPGHPSTPGYNDPKFPMLGRVARA